MSTHVLHMTRLHAKRPLLVELRVINGPFEGGCRLQSGGGAWYVGVQHIPASLTRRGFGWLSKAVRQSEAGLSKAVQSEAGLSKYIYIFCNPARRMSTREAPADAKMPVQRGRPTSKGLPKGVSVCFRLDFDYLESQAGHTHTLKESRSARRLRIPGPPLAGPERD